MEGGRQVYTLACVAHACARPEWVKGQTLGAESTVLAPLSLPSRGWASTLGLGAHKPLSQAVLTREHRPSAPTSKGPLHVDTPDSHLIIPNLLEAGVPFGVHEDTTSERLIAEVRPGATYFPEGTH